MIHGRVGGIQSSFVICVPYRQLLSCNPRYYIRRRSWTRYGPHGSRFVRVLSRARDKLIEIPTDRGDTYIHTHSIDRSSRHKPRLIRAHLPAVVPSRAQILRTEFTKRRSVSSTNRRLLRPTAAYTKNALSRTIMTSEMLARTRGNIIFRPARLAVKTTSLHREIFARTRERLLAALAIKFPWRVVLLTPEPPSFTRTRELNTRLVYVLVAYGIIFSCQIDKISGF